MYKCHNKNVQTRITVNVVYMIHGCHVDVEVVGSGEGK